MPEGKKTAVPAPKPVREEDLYSAKTHLHQPVPVQETATVSATAQLADAPEGALPSEVRPEIVTWEKLCEAIKASGRSYNMEMIEKAYDLANTAHKGVCRRSGEPYICHPLAVARLVLDLGMDSESIAAALLHDVVEDTPTTLDDLKAAFGEEVALLVDGVTKLTKIQHQPCHSQRMADIGLAAAAAYPLVGSVSKVVGLFDHFHVIGAAACPDGLAQLFPGNDLRPHLRRQSAFRCISQLGRG